MMFLYPMEGESYDSLTRRWKELYQLNDRDWNKFFFNDIKKLNFVYDHFDWTYKIHELIDNKITVKELIEQHTLFKLHTCFFTKNRKYRLSKIYSGRRIKLLKNAISTNYITLKSKLVPHETHGEIWKNCFCPECVKEQYDSTGIIWHRVEWMIPGIEMCLVHKCRLVCTNPNKYVSSYNDLKRYQYYELNYGNKKPFLFSNSACCLLKNRKHAIDILALFKMLIWEFNKLKVTDQKIKHLNKSGCIVNLNTKLLINILYDFWGKEFVDLFYRRSYLDSRAYINDSLYISRESGSNLITCWIQMMMLLLAIFPNQSMEGILKTAYREHRLLCTRPNRQ